MIYHLEIQDDDLNYVIKNQYCGRFIVNRYSDDECKLAKRLRLSGIVEQIFRDDVEVCHHPSYEVTDLGEKVLKQFLGGGK